MLGGWILLWHEKATYFAHAEPSLVNCRYGKMRAGTSAAEKRRWREEKEKTKCQHRLKNSHCVNTILYGH